MITLGKRVVVSFDGDEQVYNHKYIWSKVQELAFKNLTAWKEDASDEDQKRYRDQGNTFFFAILDLFDSAISECYQKSANAVISEGFDLSTNLADYISKDEC